MSRTPRPQGGFTLIELLVILAILAALAATLVPMVANRGNDRDIARTTVDFAAIRTAIETFIVDVRRYPGDLEDLYSHITSADTDINAAAYPDTSKWSGPYVDISKVNQPTGFDATIVDVLKWTSSGQSFAAIKLTGLSYAEFAELEEAIDGETIADTSTAADDTDGRIRYATASTVDTSDDAVYYLAVPIAN